MIYFDVTKSAKSRHASGLMRVNRRLREELGQAAQSVRWGDAVTTWRKEDWYLTTETFDGRQRDGFDEFLRLPPVALPRFFLTRYPCSGRNLRGRIPWLAIRVT
ncbi:MAG: hypothetical protein J6386_13320 [Candidatus Synoicihabitans palmerolidicus]|nr:hypothetical protein [Candidatus Synoicihabitans palmerolidicus]